MHKLVDGKLLSYHLELTNADWESAPNPEGYRRPAGALGSRVLLLSLRSASPAAYEIKVRLDVFVPIDAGPNDDVKVLGASPFKEELAVRTHDLYPRVNMVAELAIRMFVEGLVGAGDTPLKLFTAHIVDKGKPLYDYSK